MRHEKQINWEFNVKGNLILSSLELNCFFIVHICSFKVSKLVGVFCFNKSSGTKSIFENFYLCWTGHPVVIQGSYFGSIYAIDSFYVAFQE